MSWRVYVHRNAQKSIARLPQRVRKSLAALIREIEESGPVRGNWQNYSKLRGSDRHHCHLKKGHPTYVAVWEEKDRQVKIVEVIYVGTHENAPY